jgi:hypothetical protein
MYLIWSATLTMLSLTTAYLARHKPIVAWPLGLFTQAVWLCYAIATRQWPFLVSAASFSCVYGAHLRGELRERRPGRPGADR